MRQAVIVSYARSGLAKAARGDERVEFARDVIRERTRSETFGARSSAHWTCGGAASLGLAATPPPCEGEASPSINRSHDKALRQIDQTG